jgi:hypothetical protein
MWRAHSKGSCDGSPLSSSGGGKEVIYDYVVLGSRRFLKEANEIGRQVMEKGFSVKLISDPAPRIEAEGLEVVKRFKTAYQRQHFEAIRNCKLGVILCNFNGYVGLNTKAELIFAHAYDVPIFAVEPVNSNEEELKIMNIHKLDEIASHRTKTK